MSISAKVCVFCCLGSGMAGAVATETFRSLQGRPEVLQAKVFKIVRDDGVLLAQIGERDGAGEIQLFDSHYMGKDSSSEPGMFLNMRRRTNGGGGMIRLYNPVKWGGVSLTFDPTGGSKIALTDGQSEGNLLELSARGGSWKIIGKDEDTVPILVIEGRDYGAALEISHWDQGSKKYRKIHLK